MPFSTEILDTLARTKEVSIETSDSDGSVHSAIIWVVVDGDDAFVRSWKGATARWYRVARANPDVTIVAAELRVAATAVPATDAESVGRCSDGFLSKYRGSQSALAMVAEEILDTTLRLDTR
jgi:hypothetical protein